MARRRRMMAEAERLMPTNAPATTATTLIDPAIFADPTFKPALGPLRLKEGTRGPTKRDPRDDPDSLLFDEIRRLMKEKPGLSIYGAVVSLEYAGKIAELPRKGKTKPASPESRIKRLYEKFLQQS